MTTIAPGQQGDAASSIPHKEPLPDTMMLPGGQAAVTCKPGQGPKLDRVGNGFKPFGGSEMEAFNSVVLQQTIATISLPTDDPKAKTQHIGAASAALAAFKPTDEIEGMLAAQAVALHFTSMECLRRASIPEQPAEIAAKLRKDGANLARSMTDMLEALDRKRGKGQQVVRVERVVVHEGGQAVVGNVHPRVATGKG